MDNPANAHKVFILNSAEGLTGPQAHFVLTWAGAGFQPTAVVQLDGGKSTQLSVDIDGNNDGDYAIESNQPITPRKVPTVLAVYLAPGV